MPSAKYGVQDDLEYYFESASHNLPIIYKWSFHIFIRMSASDFCRKLFWTFYQSFLMANIVNMRSKLINGIIKRFTFKDNHFEIAYNLFTGKSIKSNLRNYHY